MIFGKAINRYYLKHAPVLLLGILSLLTVDYIQLLIPELYRLVINGVNLGQVVVDGQTLPFTREVLFQHICLPMIWIVVLMVIGRFLWRVCFFGSAVNVAADLRERMFDHSRRLSQQYYQVNKVGNLMSLYTNDLDTIQECFGDGILMFFDAAVLGIMALVKMWRMDCKLTLLALIPAAVMFVLGTVMSQVMTRRWEERQQAFSDLSDFAQENFSGIAVIKAFVKELKELIAFRRLNKENEEVNVAYTKIATLLEVLVTLFVESVICVILGYGGWLVWRGQFNAGQLVEYIGYFEAIVWPIMAISMLIEKTSRGKASLNRITELLDAPIDVADRDGVADLRDPHGGIEFRHLTFRYPDGEYDVLKDVSFTIKPGESVGIVGKTGAGKTALVDLLLRTYNVPDGTLFVDGQDVNAVSIHSVRDACAYVPQDNFLFSDTIAHNIGFGVDDASREDIDRAAALADVRDNIVDFKDGYETILGERGVTVSGGQKQRISIARALLKNAPILILDDSVSAVDTRTERIILDNLKTSRAGKTTLLIAHRISTVEQLDKIICIDQSPIGRTPRSNPATYTGLFDQIRKIFAASPEAKARGYKENRFSFNVKGGRCENCCGDGMLKIEMHFLPDIFVPCDVCKGKRYNRETLEVTYKGKNISDVLDMNIEEAITFFENHESIRRKLETLYDVGLGYMKLGQASTTLSGGEAQRVKLATELSRRATGKTLYVLDEPTTGLHMADVDKLIGVLQRLTETGNSVLVIEHNLDVIKVADYLIDLGPEGGDKGGEIVCEGTPEEVAACEKSYTGQFLKKMLGKR